MNLKRFIKNDKRAAPRTNVHLWGALYQNEKKIFGRVKNISSSGALVVIEEKIPFELNLHQSVVLYIELDSTPFSIPASIVRHQENKIFLNFHQENFKLSAILNLINIGEDLF